MERSQISGGLYSLQSVNRSNKSLMVLASIVILCSGSRGTLEIVQLPPQPPNLSLAANIQWRIAKKGWHSGFRLRNMRTQCVG
jgi:hypothetical protein